MVLAAASRAQSIVQEYYVPMPEAQIRQSFLLLASNTGTTMDSVVSMVVGTSGTRIVYDHWEDGYEVDIDHPTQASTQIWGDGNDANGISPGFANDPASLASGTVIALRNWVTLPRNPATLLYDGRDRVGATRGIAVSRSAWATTPGSVLADATEVNATIDWGSSFVMPIGENEIFPSPATSSMFELVSLFVQAAQNGTQVQVDSNGDGTVDTTVILNQGETYYLASGVMKGATVTASKPVQVDLLTGDIGANYESRWFTIPPLDQWGSSYYTPVGTASDGDDTYIFLYNPDAAAIPINSTTRVGTGSFSIPAKSTYRFLMPQDSGAHFFNTSSKKFFAVGTVGAEPASNNVHDWGFSLVPEDNLTTSLVVGWGPGSTDLSVNGSPVWVTAVANTRIYVDYNGDRAGSLTDPILGKYDVHYDVSALEVKRLFDPDKDQTGMRIYTLDGTLITGAWGQDPALAGPGNPYLDAGTTIPAFPVPVIHKSSVISTDVAPAGLSVGDTLEYSITMDNNSLVALGNLLVLDRLPVQLTYVAGSTTRDGVVIPDKADPSTLFPLDESGVIIPILPRGQSTTIKYRTLINAGGTITNGVLSSFVGVTASETVVVPVTGGSSACAIHFTNSGGTTVTTYNPSAGIYVQMTDADANTSATTIQTVTVLVKNTTNGDLQYVTLTETGVNTGVFLNTAALPSSPSAGLAPYDGTLNGLALDNLSVSYTDPVFGDSANAAALFAAATPTKILYLNTDGTDGDSSGGLDRVDPVATADAMTSQTAASSASTIAAAATTSGSSSSVATNGTLTFSHTPGSGANRILLVAVGIGSTTATDVTPGTVTQVTFGGTLMTKVGSTITNSVISTQIYQLVNPASGTGNVVVTLGGTASSVSASATTFTGVHQTTPLGTAASSTGSSTALSATIASATDELVFSIVAYDEGASNQSITTSTAGGQVELVKNSGFNYVTTAASTKPGASSVTVSYTGGDAQQWAVLAVPLKPAPGAVGDSFTFTQTPNFAEAFSMPVGGTLGVVNYLNVTGGTLSANPAITATVKHGTTTLATLATPTATLIGRSGSETVLAAVTNSGSNTSVASGGTLSFSHAPGSGNNRLLLVSVGVGNTSNSDASSPGTVSGVTFGGTAMTLVGLSNNGPVSNFIFSLVNPDSAAADVVVSIGTKTSSVSASATTLTGVDQIAPLGTLVPNTGTGTALSATLASATGELVYSAAAIDEGTANQSITTSTTGSQAQLVRNSGFHYVSTASSTKPGTASLAVNYTSGNSQVWAVLAVAVKPAPTPPAVYRLDWSATLASAVTVPSGAAIELTITNAGTAGCSVLYDSHTYPSRITLPTSTVIRVDAVEVYDAPYPGGTLISTPTNGQTVYVRALVGDPFGAYDITSLDLNIDGTGTSDDVAVALGASQVVATTDHLKTYEYVWNTGTTTGAYTITATANEGFEGTITSQRSTSVTLGYLDLGTPSFTEFTLGNNGSATLAYPANASVGVRVTDIDQNMNPQVVETIAAVITSSSGDSEAVTLTETGPNTGIFTCVIPASASSAGSSNNGSLHAPQGSALVVNYVDPNDSSDTSSASATVPLPTGTPGVAVAKTLLAPSDGQAMIGEAVQYRLRVVNTGSTTLETVSLTDTFPSAKLTYGSASSAPDSVVGGLLTWTNVGPLMPGQSLDVMVDFTALATGEAVTNSATANAGSGVTSTSSADVRITRPGVAVTKTLVSPNSGPAGKGGNVVFNIIVWNTGDTAISTLPLEDIFSGTVFEFISASVPPDATGSGSLLWLDITGAGNLAAGSSQTIAVTLRAIGAANPAFNLAAVNYAVDINSDPVPPATSTATVVTQAASIRGSVLEDQGISGFGDDVPLESVTLSLYRPGYGPDGIADNGDETDPVAISTTDATGYYEFLNLGLGSYIVQESDPVGYSSISDTQGLATDNQIAVSVNSFASYPDNKFLDDIIDPTDYATISGRVRNDADADGDLADSDPGIGGATLELYTDPNGDGDPSDGVLLQTTTSATAGTVGSYTFSSVPPGSYVVVETDVGAYVSTGDGDSTADSGGSPADAANPVNDNSIPLNLGARETDSGNDFLDSNASFLGKTVDKSVAGVSETLTYTLAPNYAGPDLLLDATVTDAVPSGTTFLDAGQGGVNTGPAPGTVTWSLGSNTAASDRSKSVSVPSAITYLASSTASVRGGTSLSLVMPAGVAQNDVLVAAVAWRNSGSDRTIAAPAGWVQIGTNSDTAHVSVGGGGTDTWLSEAAYYKVAGAGESGPYIFTISGSDRLSAGISAYRGVDTLAPIQAQLARANASSTNAVAPQITTTVANTMLVGIFASRNDISSGSTATPPSGMTEGYDLSTRASSGTDEAALESARVIFAGPGATGDRTATLIASSLNIGHLIALKPAATSYNVTTALSTDCRLVTSGSTVIVTLTATATGDAGTVTPGDLTVVGANGASGTFGAASPSSAILDNGTVVFTYAGTVSAGTNPGSVSFSVTPTDDNGTWAQGTSSSVLVTQSLIFSATVDSPAVANTVTNQARLLNNGSLISLSPGTLTTLWGTIGNLIWFDWDHDGLVDPGEPGLPGVTVQLYRSNQTPGAVIPLATTLTNSSGLYSFPYLVPGDYVIYIPTPPGYPPGLSVVHNTADDQIDNDNNGTQAVFGGPVISSVIHIGVGETDSTKDFGFSCHGTWEEWQFLNPLLDPQGLPRNQAGANPDGDRYDNLAEYAFKQSAASGAGDAFSIAPSTAPAGNIDGAFTRPMGVTKEVTYYLEYSSSLENPTTWTSILLDQSNTTVAPVRPCSETVTIANLEGLPDLPPGQGFVRIKALLKTSPTTPSYTEEEGWKETPLGLGCRTYSNPFLRETTFTGTVGGVSGQVITFTTGGLSGLLVPNVSYYLEVTSGTYEGHRFDVASATGSSVTLVNDASLCVAGVPFNTLTGAPPGVSPATLVDARVVIRPHWTLGEMFPASGFHASADAATADQVQTYTPGLSPPPTGYIPWTTYWLNSSGSPKWVTLTDASTNQASTVIPPGQGLFVNKRSVVTSLLAYGEVRGNAFIRPLCKGNNLVGGGYPLDQSATGAGSRQMNLKNPVTPDLPVVFYGSRDFKTADAFFVWQGDGSPGANGYDSYFLLDGAPTQPAWMKWVKVGDVSLTSRDAKPLFPGDSAAFIRVNADLHTYKIPCPWNP